MTVTRRRFLSISAASAGLALLPLHSAATEGVVRWRGRALGAAAELILHHPDRAEGERILRRVVAEIERLEAIFSLYRDDSELSRLNRDRVLVAPSPDLVALLARSGDFWRMTDGAFDPSIQPLWQLYARHFARPDADPAGPSPQALGEALDRVGFDRVIFGEDRVVLPMPGMGLTLNGVAQGYITDRAIDMLRAAGITQTLADLGEIRALGRRGDGAPWQVGIAGEPGRVIELANRALATSSPAGFRFAGPGSPSHILSPKDGGSPDRHARVTVLAPEATTADALSTGLSLMPGDRIEALLRSLPEVEVELAG